MLFIFGTRGTTGQAIHSNYNCPACGKEQSIWMVPHQRYFHIFWIPIFPTSKSYTPVCNECGSIFTTLKLPATKEIREQYKTPKWTFLGLAIFGILLAFTLTLGMTENAKKRKDLVEKIEHPVEGDIYQVVFKPREYSLLKVVSETSDSVYFVPSNHYVDRKSGLEKLTNKTDFDYDIIDAYSKSDLQQMAVKNTIIKIIR